MQILQIDGYLFEPGMSDDAKTYLQTLKDDKVLRLEMGAKGRDSVKNRSVEIVVKDIMEWYALGCTNRKQRY
jgi:hypothetical protein